MLLLELFTDPYEWEEHEENDGGDASTFVFKTDKGIPYDVDFERINTPADDIPLWSVEFSNQAKQTSPNNRFGITGSGNSPQVLATVMDIVQDFAQSHGGVYTFSASEPSRSSLYARVLKRFIQPPLVTGTLPALDGGQLFFVGMPDDVQKFKDRKEKELAYRREYEQNQAGSSDAQPQQGVNNNATV